MSELPVPGIDALPRARSGRKPWTGALSGSRRPRRRVLVLAAIGLVLAGTGAGLAIGLPARHPARAAARPASRPEPARDVAFAWFPGGWTPPGRPLALNAAGVPVYSLTVIPPSASGPTAVTTVVETATDNTTATVSPPPGLSFIGVAAARDNRTFVLAAIPPSAGFSDTNTGLQITEVKFYEGRLSPAGQPGTLALLLTLRTIADPDFALSPDGSQLAVADYNGDIEVISLATGAHRTWRTPGQVSGVSWASDRVLAFYFEPASALPRGNSSQFEPGKPDPRTGEWLLDTSKPGTDLVANSRMLIHDGLSQGAPTLGTAIFTPDGTRLFISVYSRLSQGIPLAGRVEEFDVRTGRPLASVTSLATVPAGGSGYLLCVPLWSGPSGAVLSFCDNGNNPVSDGIYFADGKIVSTQVNTPFGQGGATYMGSNSIAW